VLDVDTLREVRRQVSSRLERCNFGAIGGNVDPDRCRLAAIEGFAFELPLDAP